MKVFRLETDGEYIWICAKTNIEALKTHEAETDIGLIDFDKGDEIIEIPKSEWNEIWILDPNEWNEETGYKKEMNLTQYMKDAVSSEIICSTVF